MIPFEPSLAGKYIGHKSTTGNKRLSDFAAHSEALAPLLKLLLPAS